MSPLTSLPLSSIKKIIYYAITGLLLILFVMWLSSFGGKPKVTSHIMALEKDQSFFTGLSFATLLEFRLDDAMQFKIHYKKNDNDGSKNISFKKLIVDYLKKKTAYERTSVKFSELINSYKEEQNYTDVTLEKEYLLKDIEIYIGKKIPGIAGRKPYTKGGSKTLDAIANAAISYKEPRGFCYRVYQVGIGYDNFNKFRTNNEFSDPKILTVNAIEARAHKPNNAEVIATCDSFDYVESVNNNNRKEFIRGILVIDGAWEAQRSHAQSVYEKIGVKNNGITAESKWSLVESAFADEESTLGGYLSSLKVTVSSILGAKKDHFWSQDSYYIRKDIANIYYGTEITSSTLKGRNNWFANLFSATPIRTITLTEPYEIAMDRYIQSLFMSKNFEWGKGGGQIMKSNEIEETIVKSIEARLKKSKNVISSLTRKFLIAILSDYYEKEFPNEEVNFKFSKRDPKSISAEPK